MTVETKWTVVGEDVKEDLHALHFDEMGAVDYGVMIRAGWFLGQEASNFSFATANVRVGGRYTGSSFLTGWGGRTHLFSPQADGEYDACL